MPHDAERARHEHVEVSARGQVFNFGTAFHGSPAALGLALAWPIVGIVATPTGYLLASAGGNVYNFASVFRGSPHVSAVVLAAPIAGIAADLGRAYQLVTVGTTVYSYSGSGPIA